MKTAAELLDVVLAGAELRAEDIDQLLWCRTGEHLHLEYKRGDILSKPKARRAQLIREYAAAFANAEGGLLLVGISGGEEGIWEVTGCEEHMVGGNLKEWADDALRTLAPHLYPAPRTHVVMHEKGPVLVIAVDRAPTLVPCIENAVPVYYLRIGHQTMKIDPYLHADLVLGRRQRPVLQIEGKMEAKGSATSIDLTCRFVIENDGLVWAEDIRGLITGYFDLREGQFPNALEEPFPNALKRHLDIRQLDNNYSESSLLKWRTLPSTQTRLAPMERFECRVAFQLPLPKRSGIADKRFVAQCNWKGALGILTSNGLPKWVQLELRFEYTDTIEMHLFPGYHNQDRIRFIESEVKVLSSRERPTVSCCWAHSVPE